MDFFNRLYNSSPAEIVTFIKKKVLKKNDWNFSVDWTMQNSKYKSATVLVDRWERYRRVINNNIKNSNNYNLDFENKIVCELGCGPLLGFAPIAIFNGAKKYYYSEPFLNLKTLESKEIKNKIFRNIHSELVANYGDLISFENFYDKLIKECYSLEKINELIDLTISNSVLEHLDVSVLNDLLSSVFNHSSHNATYFHSVDFGHHLKGDKGLDRLYKNNSNLKLPTLNMLRKSDIFKILEDSGYKDNIEFTYKKGTYDLSEVHKSWQRYSQDDLESRVVFFIGKKH